MIEALNLAGMAEPRSVPHRRDMRYKRKGNSKHSMTLATREWLLIYYNPLI
jgi:hypothetical protein